MRERLYIEKSFIEGFGYYRLTQYLSRSWNSYSICILDLGKMGKRKAQKTKELSVAIAEASSAAAEAGDETKSPVVTPRKRGRPRKIVEAKAEAKQEEEQQQQQQQNPIQQAEAVEEEAEVADQTKKARTGEVEEQKQEMLQESSTKKTSSRSRARRKSKPPLDLIRQLDDRRSILPFDTSHGSPIFFIHDDDEILVQIRFSDVNLFSLSMPPRFAEVSH
ncbi:hypothetical protein BT93_F1508 [Corymbia citriodora subsp. variegata]|nr:hypothetical protein BT93_F1508 [Corymbia citriodora subsp. variegata]